MMRRDLLLTIVGIWQLASACTGQLPNSFRFEQQKQDFSSHQDVNTKIDLLWVVDNSSSMDVSQRKLRKGFSSFAEKYLKPTWDIRIAVITTDTYMAHEAFQGYLDRTIPGSVGYEDDYIVQNKDQLENPDWYSLEINLQTGAFDDGVKYGELVPAWGENYARLKKGIHDGPIAALCSNLMPYFLKGITDCQIRDLNEDQYEGNQHCINPSNSESSFSQCVNTTQNNTVRSKRPIIKTMPPDDQSPGQGWRDQLINDFMINASTGSTGQGSERGFGSVLQLIKDNENTSTQFFRKDSLRGIIFVSDEDDQTMTLPDDPPSDFTPQSYYRCDQESLLANNSTTQITGNSGYCCDDPNKNCVYGEYGTSCPEKTIPGMSEPYVLSVCPDPDRLIEVKTVKKKLDAFFNQLNGKDQKEANYFITSIVATNADSITRLQEERREMDTKVGNVKTVAVDRGSRYIKLGKLVKNGSLKLDISKNDYTQVLDKIGTTIIQKKSVFPLEREPTNKEEMIVKIIHGDGSSTQVSDDQYRIKNEKIIFKNQAFVLGLSSTDKVSINYQPNEAY